MKDYKLPYKIYLSLKPNAKNKIKKIKRDEIFVDIKISEKWINMFLVMKSTDMMIKEIASKTEFSKIFINYILKQEGVKEDDSSKMSEL